MYSASSRKDILCFNSEAMRRSDALEVSRTVQMFSCSSIDVLNEVEPKSLRSSLEGFLFGMRDSSEHAAPPQW